MARERLRRIRCPGVWLWLAVGMLGAPRALGQDDEAEVKPPQPETQAADPADAEPEPVNVLAGVVVSKADGAPQANVTIALAHKDGYISINPEGTLDAYGGASESAHEGSKKRNYKLAVKTRTDETGRFQLKGFVSLTDEYTLVASTRRRGIALLRNVIPDQYRDKPLQVELEAPATANIVVPKYLIPSGAQCYIGLQIEPRATGRNDDGTLQYAENGARVYYRSETMGSRRAEFSRLIPNVPYRVTASFDKTGLAYAATAVEHLFTPKPGETVTLFPDPAREENAPPRATLAGRITAVDGKPLKHVNVRVCLGAQRNQVWGALTNADGNYELRHLAAGKYRMELEHRRQRTAPG